MKLSSALLAVLWCLAPCSGTAMSATQADPPAWVVDPAVPGENLPPSGRSLFDRLFAAHDKGGEAYDIPFPFAKLLTHLDAQLEHDPKSLLYPAKRVLIPLGRSLQRSAAEPDYFLFPRVVVAVDSSPSMPSGLLLKDRLYIGYQERSDVLEVISYNESAGRFEFQLVKDYRAGAKPQVFYANRTLCYACHQNGAPIFSRALWDETNANPKVAALLSASGKDFYGIPPDRGVDIPYTIDIAIKRANGFALTQRLWQEGCGGEDRAALHCRAGLLISALRQALSDGRKGTAELAHGDGVDSSVTVFRAEARRQWPGGLAVGASDIPNRNPLQDLTSWPDNPARRRTYSHVPARFEPLAPRSPQEIWRADTADAIDRLSDGLAEFVSATDRQRLVDALSARPAQNIQYRAPCNTTPAASRWSVRCQPGDGESGLKLTATLDRTHAQTRTRSRASGGRLERLTLPASGTFNAIALVGTTPRVGERNTFTPDRKPLPRGADGNPLVSIVFVASPDDPNGGEVLVEMRKEFPAVEQAVTALADGPDGPVLFGSRPFPREQIFAALLARLGAPVVTPCCRAAEKLPPPQLEVAAVVPNSPAIIPVEPALQAFYPYCASCHQSAETFPPNFLTGTATEVKARLQQCAPRLYVRLSMPDQTPEHRTKTPMPPESLLPAFGTDIAGWRSSPARTALLAQVGNWLLAETGRMPNLTLMLADGYEALRPCLPTQRQAHHQGERHARQ